MVIVDRLGHLRADPAQCFEDVLVVRDKIRSVPDWLKVEHSISESVGQLCPPIHGLSCSLVFGKIWKGLDQENGGSSMPERLFKWPVQ